MHPSDVPSPIDFKCMVDALEWERTAMQRPYREEVFEAIHKQLRLLGNSRLDLLELGSGPGFLAQHILSRIPVLRYTLLDFSPAMHTLAKRRLDTVEGSNVLYIERDFKESTWPQDLGQYDAILCNQAVHELRHKRYAPHFFRQVSSLLQPNGVLLFCDHYYGEGGLRNDQLYMSLDEQREALISASFAVSEILVVSGRALYRAVVESKGSE